MTSQQRIANSPHVPAFSSRRDFLAKAGSGFGALALSCMLGESAARASGTAESAGSLRNPQHPARAKAVIFLFMEGGPSHLDTFDPKPELTRLNGQRLPASFGTVLTPMGTGGNKLLASKRAFHPYGQCGLEVSDWLPHTAACADDLAVIRSCWADGLNHVGSVCQMNTGSLLAGRPSMGSWVLYGLGSESQNLPGFVVMTDAGEPLGGSRNWGTGFMPASYQGTAFRPGSNPILFLKPPADVAADRQRRELELIQTLNTRHQQTRLEDGDLAARIASYELAFRMQAAAPEAVDLRGESEKTKEEYGLNRKECAEFGRRCLLARRLVERGVRFVQIYCGGGSQWDAHSDLEGNHTKMCGRCDQPTAALLKDLKRRGLLDQTLVVWGGEFGRTPMSEGGNGRDHNPYGFTMWLAGGGVRGGMTLGSTDELGLYAREPKVHVHDLHATILHLLGFDHKKLTYLYNGRDERLTMNGGRVVQELIR
ncbi:MAG TPA: DUF1501 domain-containing protein [Gemmataceae bacterium]|jgi:hypothetical protein|nr:DUF1501 domain-containing protein [Gemmataceae bacterium]